MPPPAAAALAFTLVELLMVIALMAVLAALLLSALAASKAKAQQAFCANNLQQVALCAQMYADDNGGKYADNVPLAGDYPVATNGAWVMGSMQIPLQATNLFYLKLGEIFPYTMQTALYKCPADLSMLAGQPRVRSYAMNGWIGSRTMNVQAQELGYQTYVRESETAVIGAANLWLALDENEQTIDDGWFLVTMNNSEPFASFPATHHQHGYTIAFADEHVQAVALRDPGTVSPSIKVTSKNTDWLWLRQASTVSITP